MECRYYRDTVNDYKVYADTKERAYEILQGICAKKCWYMPTMDQIEELD